MARRLRIGAVYMSHPGIKLALGALGALLWLNGCATLGLGLLSSGAGILTGQSVAYTMDGYAYRTFTASLPEVESATRTALHRMGIRVDATAQIEQGKALRAQTFDREIEIELEMVSAKATRMRTVAKHGVFLKDRATATEILNQTEKILGLTEHVAHHAPSPLRVIR